MDSNDWNRQMDTIRTNIEAIHARHPGRKASNTHVVMFRNGRSRVQRTISLDTALRLIRADRHVSTRSALAILIGSWANTPVVVNIIDQLWLLED